MPSVTARRRCPDLVFVPPRFDVHKAIPTEIRAVLAEHTDAIEPLSLDEVYLDVTDNKQGIASATRICTAATVHLCAAIPNLSYLECWETPREDNGARKDSPIFRSRLRLEGSSFPVPTAPGLGIEIDEDALAEAEPFRFSEMPHLVRRDGSVTSW